MRKFLHILLLSTSIATVSCMPGREYTKTVCTDPVYPLLSTGYRQALYQASVDVFDKHVSGLFLFKYDSVANEHHIVLLSEVGLSLMEMSYRNGKFTLVDCKSFIEKKQVIKTLQQDFLLLLRPLTKDSYICYSGAEGKKALKYTGKQNAWYLFADGKNVDAVSARRSLVFPVSVNASGYDQHVPQSITISHKRIKLNIELQLLTLK